MNVMNIKGLPDLTPKQLAALLEFYRAWLRTGPEWMRVLDGWQFGSSTVSRLKREGLITRMPRFGYRISDRALACFPEVP